MATEMKSAQELLFGTSGLRVSNFKMFPGSSREVTVDQIAAEIYRSVSRMSGMKPEELEVEQLLAD